MKNTFFVSNLFLLIFSLNLFAEDFLIKNAKIFTGTDQGLIKNSDIHIKDGRIQEIKNEIDISNIKVIDLNGKLITSGFISPLSQLGLVEIGLESRTRNDSSDVYSAGFSVASSFNPKSTLIPYNLTGGITLSLSSPSSGGLFSGLSSAFYLSGNLKNSLLKKDIALIASIRSGEGSKAASFLLLEDFLTYAQDRNAEKDLSIIPLSQEDGNISIRDLRAIKRVVDKEIPLVVRVDKSSDILTILDLAKRKDIELIIAGASEGWMVANELAASGVPVILTPIDNIPSSFDSLGSRLDNASMLHKAGVKLIISSHETHNAYLSRQGAGIAVSYGLPWEEAIKALTINISESFNLDKLGAIKPGYKADLVVWDGDPLEVTSFVERVFISGKEVPVENRSMRLRDRYLEN